jgi:hypothetical protein
MVWLTRTSLFVIPGVRAVNTNKRFPHFLPPVSFRSWIFVMAWVVGTQSWADNDKNKPKPRGGKSWHGDISRFHEQDWPLWRSGHWTHGRHDGRMGWWWVVGPQWYFYPTPVYPYPSPWEPPVVMPMAPSAGPPPAPAAIHWYFCPNTNNYYPYISTCLSGWVQVPAQPR